MCELDKQWSLVGNKKQQPSGFGQKKARYSPNHSENQNEQPSWFYVPAIDVHDGGIGQRGEEKVLLLVFDRDAIPHQRHGRQHSAGSQRVIQQLHRLVHPI